MTLLEIIMSNLITKKISQLLRAKESVILDIEKKMRKVVKNKNALADVLVDNEKLISKCAVNFGLARYSDACRIYQALINKTKECDQQLMDYFHQPNFLQAKDCQNVLNKAKEISRVSPGFFLKPAKAQELLRINPPRKILQVLGCRDVEELLAKENVWEIFSALRFVEDRLWLNDVFFKPYQNLSPDDFEQREIQVIVLSDKWAKIGREFVGKKLHHLSHLKELGLVFVIPFSVMGDGAILEVLTLILHYLHEIDFYGRLFKRYSQTVDFGKKLIESLQGQVLSESLAGRRKPTWRIIQRYLAKEDATDPRLLEPHVNPEAIHWYKAEADLARWGKTEDGLGLEFWDDLDFVGDFFMMPKGYSCPLDGLDHRVINFPITRQSLREGFTEMLVSFDLIDNIISLSQQRAVESKYLYHQQEALWNEIFSRYVGRDKLEELILENLDKGYIEL